VSAYQEIPVIEVTPAAVESMAVLAYLVRRAIQVLLGALASLDRQGRKEEMESRDRKAKRAYLVKH